MGRRHGRAGITASAPDAAIDDADEHDSIPGWIASVLRFAADRAPIGWLTEHLPSRLTSSADPDRPRSTRARTSPPNTARRPAHDSAERNPSFEHERVKTYRSGVVNSDDDAADGWFGESVAARYDAGGGVEYDEAEIERTVDVLAELTGDGPTLELAIGTGQVALPLSGTVGHGSRAST